MPKMSERQRKEYLRIITKRAAGHPEWRETSVYTEFGRNIPYVLPELKEVLSKIKKKRIVIHEIGVGRSHADPLTGIFGNYSSEPYELINLAERTGKKAEVYALDQNQQALKSSKQLKEMSFKPALLTKKSMDYLTNFFFTKQHRKITKDDSGVHFKDVVSMKIPQDAKRRVHFVKADILTATPAKRADFSVCLNVFEHYDNRPKEAKIILKNIVSAMRKNAYFFTDYHVPIGRPSTVGLKEIKSVVAKDKAALGYKLYKKIR